jgi:hypothetical protein
LRLERIDVRVKQDERRRAEYDENDQVRGHAHFVGRKIELKKGFGIRGEKNAGDARRGLEAGQRGRRGAHV